MTLSPRTRRLVLIAHIATSVGWVGAVAAYLVLDITAVTGTDPFTVRAAYSAMDMIIWNAIVPLAIASVLIGVVNALGTRWGIFRHWWVVVKLLLTLFATVILVSEAQTVSTLANMATSIPDPRGLPGTLPHSMGGLVVLLAITALAVIKPRGLTRYGWRKQREVSET